MRLAWGGGEQTNKQTNQDPIQKLTKAKRKGKKETFYKEITLKMSHFK
jgi:hypothetical protein